LHNSFTIITKYLKHRLKANTRHGTHSPFVYALLNNVFYNKGYYYAYGQIENLRSKLLSNKTIIEHIDLGAGSRKNKSKELSIRQIARQSLKKPKLAKLLFRLVNNQQPAHIIELGTSLGITTAYLAKGNTAAQVFTFEGSPAIAQQALKNFAALKLNNVFLKEGNFNQTLPQHLKTLEQPINLAYIDGNHTYQATIDYFNWLLPKVNNDSILIFDDIYWSVEMEKAWQEIKNHPKVTISIDCFYIGLIFFKQEKLEKEHFYIRL
jgi:predicted O-methyltransferase YrrM